MIKQLIYLADKNFVAGKLWQPIAPFSRAASVFEKEVAEMTITSGLRAIFSLSPFSSQISGSQSVFARGRTSLTAALSIKEPSDAVKSELSVKSARNTEEISAATKGSGAHIPGAAFMLFKEIRDLTSRLSGIDETLSQAPQGSTAQESLMKESEALNTQLKQLLQGNTLRSFTDLAGNVQSMLQGGASSSLVSRALQSQRSLVGDGFIAAVQNGDLSSIGQASSSAKSLLDLGAQDFTGSETWKNIGALAEEGIKSLSSAYGTIDETSDILPTVGGDAESVPNATTTFLDLPGKLSLQITSYTGADLIKAVKAHVLPDARNLVHLIVDPPDKEKAEKDDAADAAM